MKSEEIREVVDKLQGALAAVQRMYETKTRQEAEFKKLVSDQEPITANWRDEIRRANPQFMDLGPDYQETVLKKLDEMFSRIEKS